MKFPIKFIIALLALVIGITGALVCLLPRYGPEKVVYDYIAAAQKGDSEKMYNCTAMKSIENALNNMYGSNNDVYGELKEDYEEETEDDTVETAPVDTSLIRTVVSLPENAKQVTSTKVIGCESTAASDFGIMGYNVTALIKVTYLDDKDEECTKVSSKHFSVVKTDNSYKIMDF